MQPTANSSLSQSDADAYRTEVRTELAAALAIAKPAADAGRGLTSDEESKIAAHRRNADRAKYVLEHGHGAPSHQSRGESLDDLMTLDGARVVTFGAKDSISAHLARRGAFGADGDGWGGQASKRSASIGRLIRAGVTGRNLTGLSRAEASSLSGGSLSNGGLLASPEIFGSVIDAARPLMATARAGARTVLMDQPVAKFVRVDAPVVPGWVAEEEEQVESAPTFSALVLTATNLAVEVRISEELLQDAPDAEQVVEEQLIKGFAQELDRVGLVGTGANGQPRGIAYAVGVLTDALGANGSVPTSFDWLIDALFAVRAENYEPTAGIYSVRTAKTLAKLKRTIETLDQLPVPAEVAALARYATTQIGNDFTQGSSTASSIAIVGDFTSLLFGIRSELRIEASKHAYNTTSGSAFSKRQVAIRGWLRGDVGLLRKSAFHVTTGINAS